MTVLRYLLCKCQSLVRTCIVNAPLQDTAAVLMGCDLIELLDDLGIDEVGLLFFEGLEGLLDDVVSVVVLDEINYVLL